MTQALLFDHIEQVRRGAKTTVREKRTPSHYQQAILDTILGMFRGTDVEQAVRAITVDATAGSGKSTLLEMIAALLVAEQLLPVNDQAVFLSFNTHIVKPLRKVIPKEFDVRSVSSLGHLICTKNQPGLKFEPRKYEDLIRDTVNSCGIASPATRRELRERLASTVELHVGHDLGLNIGLQEWSDMLNEVDAPVMGAEEALHKLTLRVLRHGLTMLKEQNVMSFLDQTLAPSAFGWTLPTPYAFLLVDELQDLSKAQLGLLQAATTPQSRLVGVGDENQSLYAFNGADARSMQRFTETFHAVNMPLSISYRCPSRHVTLARPFTTAIEAAPNAKGGTLDDISSDEFFSLVRPGQLALCRTNAPLIAWCYRLIAQGIPAVVRGRDLAKSLVALARDAATWDGRKPNRDQVKDNLPLMEFLTNLNEYCCALGEKIEKEAERDGSDPALRLASIGDRLVALTLVLEQGGAQTLGQLVADIRLLFQGDAETSLVLSTVHRAKGLEADAVYILEPELLPFPKARTPQALETERCLQFVAFTRSKGALYFVDPVESRIPDALRAREAA